jgi:flagellar basal-body rod modification protein FlgD
VNLNSIVQQLQAQHQPSSSGVTANAVSANATSSQSAADDNATITANDFITLLVTELKNQDPTADTDPNAYVNQLINVNSLQQLISINQGVTSLGTIGSTSVDVLAAIDQNVSALDPTTPSSTSGSAGASTPNTNAMAQAISPAQVASAQASYGAFQTAPASAAQGLDPTSAVLNTQRARSIPGAPKP